MNSHDTAEIVTTEAPQYVHSANNVRDAVERNGRVRWWKRRGSKRRGFQYLDARGQAICNDAHCERIRALGIPPAWKEVRIAPSERSPLQAVGVDASGRVQYLYHTNYVAQQQHKKYAKIERFGQYLPALRRKTNEHLLLEGFPREKILAIVVRLINDLYFRMGSEKSVAQYHTFGVTTLRNYHLHILRDTMLIFRFTGKHHVLQRRILVDADLAALMRNIKALEGPRLFYWVDTYGREHAVNGHDVNNYIKEITEPEFSAKDFRTWGGTLKAAVALAEMEKPESGTQVKRNITRAIKQVAEELGNTAAICRQSYIHPVVFERYNQGITLADYRRKAERAVRHSPPEYEIEELELLKLFKQK